MPSFKHILTVWYWKLLALSELLFLHPWYGKTFVKNLWFFSIVGPGMRAALYCPSSVWFRDWVLICVGHFMLSVHVSVAWKQSQATERVGYIIFPWVTLSHLPCFNDKVPFHTDRQQLSGKSSRNTIHMFLSHLHWTHHNIVLWRSIYICSKGLF